MKKYDKINRESGNFPITEKEEKDFEKYRKNIKKHLEEDIKESKKSIEEDKELEKTLGRMK